MEDLKSKAFLLEKNIKIFFDGIPIPSYVWQENLMFGKRKITILY